MSHRHFDEYAVLKKGSDHAGDESVKSSMAERSELLLSRYIENWTMVRINRYSWSMLPFSKVY